IDFTEPEWLIFYYHLIGGVSVIMNTLGIYLLLYQCNAIGSFRYWLLAYQLMCFATDLQFTLLMQPVPLYPIIAGYSMGVLSKWFSIPSVSLTCIVFPFLLLPTMSGYTLGVLSYFGVNEFFMVVLVLLAVNMLANTFLLKHQSVSSISNSFVIPKFVNGIIFLVFGIVLIAFEIVLYSACFDEKDKWIYIELNYPEYIRSFQQLQEFEVMDGEKIIFIAKFLIGFGFFGSTILLLVVIDIFQKLKVLKLKISPKNYRKHSEAMRCLLVQSIAVGIAALPLLLFGISLAAENIDGQFWAEIGIACFATHSSLNMILLMIFFPPYRNFVKKNI
ncbi:Protein CBG04925, partial [Caenorhabditis briggsae]